MHHEQEYDANPTAGLQDPGANASIAAFSSNRSLANLVASDGENKWRKALEMSVPAIVVLKVTQNRSFDTEGSSTSYATGFVVDLQRGLILTNRHVITPGPISAEAIFLNREELPVLPIYYDPIHDFGFLRFDPSKLEFMRPGEIKLAPDAAAVGLDVRVVGNDSGEKVAILAGTLARLDRDAPKYGNKGYNDFNTFYLQAASGTKGGSSGSPVIDIHGRAVGLNAGGKNKAASAYYLPLHCVVRALRLLQACAPERPDGAWRAPHIPRGDLQTTYQFKGFDEARRLGVSRVSEAAARAQQEGRSRASNADALLDGSSHQGMLVVESIVPGSPADGVLEPGDVLISLNGTTTTHFYDMESLLDDCVGRTVTVVVERGGLQHSAALQVTDLHSVTPNRLLEVCGGAVHALSYQQARNNRVAVGQVYVAESGYMLHRAGVPKHAIITTVANTPTPTVDTFTDVLLGLQQGEQVPIEYYLFSERTRRKQGILHVDWKWYGPPTCWVRNDITGYWDSAILEIRPPATPRQRPVTPAAPRPPPATAEPPRTTSVGAAIEALLQQSLVWVDVDIPIVALLDGVHSRSFAGAGSIVHLTDTLGLVLVDRNTVAIGAVNIQLDFGAYPCQTYGRVCFLHPLHNFALVAFSPQDLSAAARQRLAPCTIAADPPLAQGDRVHLVGMTRALKVLRREATVTTGTSSVCILPAEVPRFRAVHEEVVKLDHDFGVSVAGVLTNDEGAVRALWGSYSEQIDREDREWAAGMHAYAFTRWVEAVAAWLCGPAGTPTPRVVVLDAELEPQSLSRAAQFGLPSEWVTALVNFDPERRQVLRVRSCVAGSHAATVLKDGDLLLAMQDRVVSSFRDVAERLTEFDQLGAGSKRLSDAAHPDGSKRPRTDSVPPLPSAAAQHDAGGQEGAMKLTICRDGEVSLVSVQPAHEDGMGTDRLVHWCGAQVQAPPRCVRELGYLPKEGSGVYVSRWHHGSPAHRYGLYAMHWVLSVNGVATPDLNTFVDVVSALKDGEYVRVRVCHLESTTVKMLTIKPDLHYWPTWELRLDTCKGEWQRIPLASVTA